MANDHPRLSLSALLLWACIPAVAASAPGGAGSQTVEPLPAPVINPRSTEICMNSRLSYHGGWNAAATEQMLANMLLRAPVYIYADGLTAEDTRLAQLVKVRDLADSVRDLATAFGPGARIGVLPQGPLTIPYIADRVAVG